jgi:hypothetical protein
MIISASENIVSIPEMIMSVPKTMVRVTEPIISPIKIMVATAEKIILVGNTIVSATETMISVTQKIMSVPETMVVVIKIVFIAMKKMVSTIKTMVFLVEVTVCETQTLFSEAESISSHAGTLRYEPSLVTTLGRGCPDLTLYLSAFVESAPRFFPQTGQVRYEPGKPNKTEYTLTEAAPGVTRIRDYFGYNCAYIIKGKSKGAIIDTGMGEGNLRAIVGKYAGGLPLELIITHGHIDHSISANQFETVYMNRKDDVRLPKNVNSRTSRRGRSSILAGHSQSL